MADPSTPTDGGRRDGEPLGDLSKRLDAARKRTAAEDGESDAGAGDAGAQGRALGQGFRLASELLAAVIVGLGLGFGLDALAGTSPWGLIGGLFLGFAAGLNTVVRTMKTVDLPSAGGQAATDEQIGRSTANRTEADDA